MTAAPASWSVGRLAAEAQRRAANPAASVWVGASAGSGKTKVLTDRVLALLLAGTEPSRILCLTFTRAAAAEMANRIALRLSDWVTFSDRALARDLMRILGRRPDLAACEAARRLFCRVLDSPGGMRIQTIHAFCQSLLRRFPLEAELPPHFQLLDEGSSRNLLRAAREAVLSGARAGADEPLAGALATVASHATETDFAELMQTLTEERHRLAALLRRHGGIEGAIAAARQRLGGIAESPEAARAAACADEAIDLLGLRLAAAALGEGSETDRRRGAAIAAWLAAPERRAETFDAYAGQFLVEKDRALCARDRLITRAAAAASPGVAEILGREAERLLAACERIRAATLAAATAALLRLGGSMLETYREQKMRRALVDYDDLILAARDLLARPGVAPWVLFKLDGGIDHILIDEAQDTNPEQWQVIAALAEEFFAEESRPDRPPRTVFAVGDPKQSIFSFQGADPEAFEAMRRHFRERVERAGGDWDEVPLDVSFRSTAAVLQAVDRAFAGGLARDGVAFDGRPIRHRSWREGQAGMVELWPPCCPLPAPEPEPWLPPVERRPADSPLGRLARLIAIRIAAMVERAERLPSRDRPLLPGDVMVLVRRRNAFLEELVRELKQRAVPVAGIDRMVLLDQLAVMDLVALGNFLLLPQDDLALATVLKGPLVGLEEEALFALAWPRRGSLWAELGHRHGERPAFRRGWELLSDLLARADFVPPFELYADLLGRLGGRLRLLERLGPEAADPLDEFLNLALQYEREHVPSLQGFLHWLEAGAVEVKRDSDQGGGGAVRIMTVHGAKGLQAPVLFLPDTTQLPNHTRRLLWCPPRQPGDAVLPLWSPRVGCDEAVAREARQRQREAEEREHRRLLYVAMTRAEDRLYVCGWQGKNALSAECWYSLIKSAMAEGCESFLFDCRPELGPEAGWSGPGLRLACPQTRRPRHKPSGRRQPDLSALPDWAGRPPAPEPAPLRPLAPSRPPEAAPAVRPPLAAAHAAAFRRGRIVHRLLELLPALPAARRAEACRRFLAWPVHGLGPEEQAALAAETLALLADPAFAPLFEGEGLAEAPLVGEVLGADGPRALTGRIDRLLVTPERVILLDYKTNRPPPIRPEEVPPPYLRQMAAYRAALARIYPDRPITCGILWTDGPRLMPLPEDMLDRWAPD